MATDGDSQQEDEMPTNPPDGENDVEEISTGGSGPKSSDMLLQGLVLDTRGVDIEHIGQLYFVSQMPENDLRYFRSAEHHWVDALWAVLTDIYPV
jgi:hypothetical protein